MISARLQKQKEAAKVSEEIAGYQSFNYSKRLDMS